MERSLLDDLGEEVTGIAVPVSICMALTVVLVRLLNADGGSDSTSVRLATIYYDEEVGAMRRSRVAARGGRVALGAKFRRSKCGSLYLALSPLPQRTSTAPPPAPRRRRRATRRARSWAARSSTRSSSSASSRRWWVQLRPWSANRSRKHPGNQPTNHSLTNSRPLPKIK